MTGTFAPAVRAGECVSSNCRTPIRLGELVYLFHKLERQTVCLDCARSRWGYQPSDEQPRSASASSPRVLGFDSTKQILRSLQSRSTASDGKWKQSRGEE